jgi:hypothetical protein
MEQLLVLKLNSIAKLKAALSGDARVKDALRKTRRVRWASRVCHIFNAPARRDALASTPARAGNGVELLVDLAVQLPKLPFRELSSVRNCNARRTGDMRDRRRLGARALW